MSRYRYLYSSPTYTYTYGSCLSGLWCRLLYLYLCTPSVGMGTPRGTDYKTNPFVLHVVDALMHVLCDALVILFESFGWLKSKALILWMAWMGCSKVIELETAWQLHNQSLVLFSTMTCFEYIWSQFLHFFLASQTNQTEMKYWTGTVPGDDFLELVSCILVCESRVLLGYRWSPLIHVAPHSSWEYRGWNQLQSCFLVPAVGRGFWNTASTTPNHPGVNS